MGQKFTKYISFLLFLLLFSCAKSINKSFRTVKIHTSLPYSVIAEKTQSTSKQIFDLSKYDTLTIIRSAKPIVIKVLIGDSSQTINIKSKISPLISLNLPILGIGAIGTAITFRHGFEYGSGRAVLMGGLGLFALLTDSKSNDRFTYPHNIYIYEKNKKAYYLPFNKKILDQKNAIKISPLRLIDGYSPSYELALERKLNDRFSGQILYGKMNNKPYKIGIENSFKGQRYGYELRLYTKKTAPFGPYIALDHNRLSQKYTDILRFSKDSANNYSSYPDSVKITNKINSVNIKVGYQYINNHFLFDIGFGIGKRIETVRHFDRINENSVPQRPFLFERNERSGQYQTINLPITFKFGYSF